MRDQTEPVGADIQVVARSAAVLDLFSDERRAVRVVDVAEHLEVGRTTAHRYLASMANAGLLEREEDGGYGLGPKLVHVGALALRKLRVVDLADPYLRDLADTASETSVLAVWDGAGPVVVRSHEPQDHVLSISIRVGRTLNYDAAQTAVFLAHRPDDGSVAKLLEQLGEPHHSRIRRRIAQAQASGIAISDTVNQGTRGIASPVFDREGAITATVAIIGTVHTLSADPASGKVRALRDTAEALSAALGFRRPPGSRPGPAPNR